MVSNANDYSVVAVFLTGTPAEMLCISENLVYALNSSGEILVRYGITPANPSGDYWKKIPGAFKYISGETAFSYICHCYAIARCLYIYTSPCRLVNSNNSICDFIVVSHEFKFAKYLY